MSGNSKSTNIFICLIFLDEQADNGEETSRAHKPLLERAQGSSSRF